jgi:uncharacterized membrane protein YuzA (DUF378 family)
MAEFWGALTADLVGVILGTLGFWTAFTGLVFAVIGIAKVITVRRDHRHTRPYNDDWYGL